MARSRPADYMRVKKQGQRHRAQRIQQELKAGMPCAHCGVFGIDPRKLHWHHVDPLTKHRNVGKERTLEGVKRELQKCILLCGSCHSKEHARLRRLQRSYVPVTARFADSWMLA